MYIGLSECVDNAHIIGLLLDVAASTGMTDKKMDFIKQKRIELQVDSLDKELQDTCVLGFHGMQSQYLREHSSLETREKAYALVNEMMASDPNASVNALGELMLQILPKVLGV